MPQKPEKVRTNKVEYGIPSFDIHSILTTSTQISLGIGVLSFLLASGFYAGYYASQRCNYSDSNINSACGSAAAGLGLSLTSVGSFFFAKSVKMISNYLDKDATPNEIVSQKF